MMRSHPMRLACAVVVACLGLTTAQAQTPLAGVKHGSAVSSVAFSPDGKSFFSGGGDNSVRVWDAVTGKELRALAGARDRITALAVSGDGKNLFASSADGSITAWDPVTGQQRLSMRGHRGGVRTLALSADGQSLATGGEDFRIFVWNAPNGQLMRLFQGHRTGITGLAYAPDGKTLASAGEGSIRLWEINTGREIKQLAVTETGLRSIAFAADGKTIAGGCKDTVVTWDVNSGKELHKIAAHKGAVTALAFAPDGRALASAGEDGAILLWEPSAGKLLRVAGRHRGSVNALAYAANGKQLVSGGEDQAVMIWEVSRLIPVPEKPIDLSAKQLDGLWGELGNGDVVKAYTAMGSLVAGSKQSLPFLQKQLRSIPPSDDEKKIVQLIRELDDDNFAVRERATSALETLGQAATLALKAAMAGGDLSLEARRRAERVLEKLKAPVLSAEQLRLQRTVEVLSTIGTPEARKMLEELSRGKPTDWLTVEAKAALELLNKRTQQ